jgi:prepilin-type processing-associated H-X9-DG protein
MMAKCRCACYTFSHGGFSFYGPGSNGKFLTQQKVGRIRRPSLTITVADGVYAGRQRDTRFKTTNSRIGYRHPNTTTNVAFADGHVEALPGHKFPRGVGAAGTTWPTSRKTIFRTARLSTRTRNARWDRTDRATQRRISDLMDG